MEEASASGSRWLVMKTANFIYWGGPKAPEGYRPWCWKSAFTSIDLLESAVHVGALREILRPDTALLPPVSAYAARRQNAA